MRENGTGPSEHPNLFHIHINHVSKKLTPLYPSTTNYEKNVYIFFWKSKIIEYQMIHICHILFLINGTKKSHYVQ